MFELADRSFEHQPPVMGSDVVDSTARAIAGYCAKFRHPRPSSSFTEASLRSPVKAGFVTQ